MGCPGIYYKRALQAFAYGLTYPKDKNKAKELFEEKNEDILEEEILKKKNELSDKEFYFLAGRVSESVFNDADRNDGCDGFNACIGGLNQFESFIGIEDEDED